MRGWGAVVLVVLTMVVPARVAADDSDDVECAPACRLGFECVKGSCVAAVCKPSCRSGFSCIEGECKSPCNPPCATGERCTSKLECVRMSTARGDDDDETPSTVKAKVSPETPPEAPPPPYKPSSVRVYAGVMLWGLEASGRFLTDLGATLALDAHVGEDKLFFVGFRTGVVGDSSGTYATFDLEGGLRPRLFESGDTAFAIVIAGGVGGGLIVTNGTTIGLFHLPFRVGPSFDFGAFTTQLLVGPALIANKAVVGTFEGMVEIGARF